MSYIVTPYIPIVRPLITKKQTQLQKQTALLPVR